MTSAAPKIKEAYVREPVAIVFDNSRIHKRSCAENIDIPKTIQKLGFFHLFTIPHSTKLNAIEMVFSQLKGHVVSEFARSPEKRKDLETMIDE